MGQTIDENNSENLRSVIDTNLMGLVFCTREAVKSIKERNVDGHIIHINSIAGHFLPYNKEGDSYGIYSASKFAVTAMAESHRQEFMRNKLNIKVTVSIKRFSNYDQSIDCVTIFERPRAKT